MANMKKVFIAVMVIGLTFTTIPVFAQSGKEALFGLKKLQARCQAGISYRDYSNAVADAKFPANLFMESADAKKSPELTDSMKVVMRHYEYAGKLWTSKISAKSILSDKDQWMLSEGLITSSSSLGREVKELYPQAKGSGEDYLVDYLLPIIWNEASKELENATKLYAKMEEDASNNNNIDKLKKENEKLKAATEIEKLKAENEKLKKQLESMTPKKKK